jgi:hypothetical protein
MMRDRLDMTDPARGIVAGVELGERLERRRLEEDRALECARRLVDGDRRAAMRPRQYPATRAECRRPDASDYVQTRFP